MRVSGDVAGRRGRGTKKIEKKRGPDEKFARWRCSIAADNYSESLTTIKKDIRDGIKISRLAA
jgi:hypothetical protein